MARQSIYDFIAKVLKRPGMWLRDDSLHDLEYMLLGYESCLDTHSIEENLDGRKFTNREFADWLRKSQRWRLPFGWAAMITMNTGPEENALERFSSLLEEYRASTT